MYISTIFLEVFHTINSAKKSVIYVAKQAGIYGQHYWTRVTLCAMVIRYLAVVKRNIT